MKKAMVLSGVLFLMASMTQAAILDAWVTTDNSLPTAGQTFDLTIWLEVVPDPSISPPEDVSNFGISRAVVTLLQQDPPGNCEPIAAGYTGIAATQVKTAFNTTAFDISYAGLGNNTPASLQDGNGDGYLDATMATGLDGGDDFHVGVNTPVWLCTETWQEGPVMGMTTFHPVIDPSSQHWDFTDPNGDESYQNSFTGFATGLPVYQGPILTVYPEDLVIGIPEPTTLAIIGIGLTCLAWRKRSRRISVLRSISGTPERRQ